MYGIEEAMAARLKKEQVELSGRLHVVHEGTVTVVVARPPAGPAVQGILTIQRKVWTTMQTIPDNVSQHFSVAWVDAEGNPTTVASVGYSVTPADIGTIMPDGDPLAGATFTPATTAGHLGVGQIKVVGTNADSTQAIALGDFEVVGSDAASGTVTFGPPVAAG